MENQIKYVRNPPVFRPGDGFTIRACKVADWFRNDGKKGKGIKTPRSDDRGEIVCSNDTERVREVTASDQLSTNCQPTRSA